MRSSGGFVDKIKAKILGDDKLKMSGAPPIPSRSYSGLTRLIKRIVK